MENAYDADKTYEVKTIPKRFIQSSNISKDKPLVSLGIRENEPIKDAEDDMEQFTRVMWDD